MESDPTTRLKSTTCPATWALKNKSLEVGAMAKEQALKPGQVPVSADLAMSAAHRLLPCLPQHPWRRQCRPQALGSPQAKAKLLAPTGVAFDQLSVRNCDRRGQAQPAQKDGVNRTC